MTSEIARLPPLLRPHQTCELARFGSEADGGYLINRKDVLASDGLISMGIEKDWRFERDVRRAKRVPVHAYDGCTSNTYLLRDTKTAMLRRNWRWAGRSLLNALEYNLFFKGSVRHFRKFVATTAFAYDDSDAPTISIAEVFRAMPGRRFLKVDIEGSEYQILAALLEQAQMTTGLAIEFHHCDRHIEEIAAFVERYPLTLVHTHANSFGGVGSNGIPKALELTFSSKARRTTKIPVVPHALDRPNDGLREIPLDFV